MKDCMKDAARDILSIQDIEQLDSQHYYDTDPSVRFFGLEWRAVFNICEEIDQDTTSFWTQLEEKNTVNPIELARTISALNKMEYDVGNHSVALHEKRRSVERELWAEKYNKRRKSCNVHKVKHEKMQSRQTSLNWMGRGSKDKEEDSGIEISSTESNDIEDMKYQMEKHTNDTNHNEKITHKMADKSFAKKKKKTSFINNITFLVKSRLIVDK